MSARPGDGRRPRRRRGSLERPVNGPLYRGSVLLLALPLLVPAFTVGRPAPLPAPTLPTAFDTAAAVGLAREFARLHPDRSPGSAGARRAGAWVTEQLRTLGFATRADRFEAEIPGVGRRTLENVSAVVPGQTPQTIVIAAHRDDDGRGPGASDNASGTAALIELARSYAAVPATLARRTGPAHTLVFLSTDGGAFGSLGAARFATHSPYRRRVVAVISLDAIAGPGEPRLVIAGDEPRSPAAPLVRTAAARVEEQTGDEPRRPNPLGQLIDLAFPFSVHEQAPFLAERIPAVTLTTGGERPPPPFTDTAARFDVRRFGELGRAARSLLDSLDAGVELTAGSGSYVYLGRTVVRGWAIQVVLVAALFPFLIAAVDLFARCRRRRIALGPAVRSLVRRLGFWLYAGALFALAALVGLWPDGEPRPIAPGTSAAGDWPLLAIGVFSSLAAAGWFLARTRLLPRRPATHEEELAGYTVALLALGVVGLLVIATNPFALVFLLPSLHAWLWLPQVRTGPRWTRAGVVLLGLTGPLLILASFATRYGLGLDAPWYVAALAAVGYVSPVSVLIALAWFAAAGQLFALAAGRYGAYPSASERPPRGLLREAVRVSVLGVRRRRAGAPEGERRALNA